VNISNHYLIIIIIIIIIIIVNVRCVSMQSNGSDSSLISER